MRSRSCATRLSISLFFVTVLACQSASSPGPGAAVEIAAREWRELGVPGDRPTTDAAPLDREVAAAAFEIWPEDDANQALLAAAYFPELGSAVDAALPLEVATAYALRVTLPEHDGQPMTIRTRGHTVRVRTLGSSDAAALRLERGVAYYGAGHLWRAAGRQGGQGCSWVAERVEEYVIATAAGMHRAAYEITLPPTIVAVHDARTYLELLDQRGSAVLRFHYAVARGRDGQTRQATTRIAGLEDGREVGASGANFAVAGDRLWVQAELDLQGLTPPVVVDPGWSSTASLASARRTHTATLLPNGKVLVAGGYNGTVLDAAEIFDPATGAWSDAGVMSVGRQTHTATLLANGKVLVAGGWSGGALDSYQLFDPAGGGWLAPGGGHLIQSRRRHTATLLNDGRVLLVGGMETATSTAVAATELYDPTSDVFTAAGDLAAGRWIHDAVLLSSGKVLVVGGQNTGGVPLASAELFDPAQPAASAWTTIGAMTTARSSATATLLPDETVVVVAGDESGAGTFSTTWDRYDVAGNTWGPSPTPSRRLAVARQAQTATLIPAGLLVIAGGGAPAALAAPEIFDPAPGASSWTSLAAPGFTPRTLHTATLLPSGVVLVAGGEDGTAVPSYFGSAQILEPALGATAAPAGTLPSLSEARENPTATLLTDGRVLVTGGYRAASYSQAVDIYHPTLDSMSAAVTPLPGARSYHTATLLHDGKVLVAGGRDATAALAALAVFDAGAGTWLGSSSLQLGTARYRHTATLLADGRVLIAGGMLESATQTNTATSELCDATGCVATAGSMNVARRNHSATRLVTGQVLVLGGYSSGIGGSPLLSAELYDPATEQWIAIAAALSVPRHYHRATLLPSGQVLVTGGSDSSGNAVATSELFEPGVDPATGIIVTDPAMDLVTARTRHSATLLPSGKVLLAGGESSATNILASVETFDPATGVFTEVATPLGAARTNHAAVLLANGKVLIAAGSDLTAPRLASVELFAEGAPADGWRPQPTLASGPRTPGSQLTLDGVGLRGSLASEASGGANPASSPTNFPVVRLAAMNGDALFSLAGAGYSFAPEGVKVTVELPASVPFGNYIAFVFANGIVGGLPLTVIECQPGVGCDDQDLCTHTDTCGALGFGCRGTSLSCVDDAPPCGALRACNGSPVCAATYPGDTTPCDDSDACTEPDACDGSGHCLGTSLPSTAWYRDADNDGHGDPNVVVSDCRQPSGHVALGDDCDDSGPCGGGCYPGNPVLDDCDGHDQDCAGGPDDRYAPDASCGVGVCRLTNTPSACVAGAVIACTPGSSVAAADVTCDGVDDDCDGFVDEDVNLLTSCPPVASACERAVCGLASGICETSVRTGCCEDASACALPSACISAGCDVGARSCVYAALPGCCRGAADCDDGNPCTVDRCNATSGACENSGIIGCCNTDADCDDADLCSYDECTSAARCLHRVATCATAGPCGADPTCSYADISVRRGDRSPIDRTIRPRRPAVVLELIVATAAVSGRLDRLVLQLGGVEGDAIGGAAIVGELYRDADGDGELDPGSAALASAGPIPVAAGSLIFEGIDLALGPATETALLVSLALAPAAGAAASLTAPDPRPLLGLAPLLFVPLAFGGWRRRRRARLRVAVAATLVCFGVACRYAPFALSAVKPWIATLSIESGDDLGVVTQSGEQLVRRGLPLASHPFAVTVDSVW
ncbi:MAG: hypothetical protein HY903_00450 [Deltaproteobacteria bacterium]|nr:hypothetical protein [Deltaproteobacteria bacterium]